MLESVKLAIVMAVALSFCSPCSSGAIEETIEYETTNSDRTYRTGPWCPSLSGRTKRGLFGLAAPPGRTRAKTPRGHHTRCEALRVS